MTEGLEQDVFEAQQCRVELKNMDDIQIFSYLLVTSIIISGLVGWIEKLCTAFGP